MIDKKHFPDNCSRSFVPYKGYFKILADGTSVQDENLSDPDGPFEIISDSISHEPYSNWHTLYNLIDSNGKKLLPKGIRTIEYYGDYYLLEDNNEDELINNSEVKGCFKANEYRSQMNVMFKNGTLLSEKWFQKVVPFIDYFQVWDERGRIGKISLNGEMFEENIYHIKFGCTIKPQNNHYTIFTSLYDIIVEDCTSVMWSSGELWMVGLLHNGKYKVYLHGQGDAMINYAHEIMIKPTVLALVEKEGIWYAVDSKGMLTKQFMWDIQQH